MVDSNFLENERKAGRKASATLRGSLKSKIKSYFHNRSGAMAKSNVTAKYKEGRLDRLVLGSPHYSFKHHFGSSLHGTTPETHRKETSVKSFTRHLQGKSVQVSAHNRRATSVAAHIKGINYKATNHIASALKATNALEQLATDLGQNRIVDIASQIDFQ